VTDPSDYVRQVESYLCQKNKGHLIRVVGPAFELVCEWVARGVPLKVALRGIDRCCERRLAKGVRRRPIRIEFCEADVLDAFDEWRRAVGATAIAGEDGNGVVASRKPSRGVHLERVIARLAHVRGGGPPASELHRQLDQTVRQLEEIAASAARARGDARAGIIARLAELDAALMTTARGALIASEAERLRAEAIEELAPFGARMPADARTRATDLAFQRLVRDAAGLPTLTYE
jgi:hypothetical protein